MAGRTLIKVIDGVAIDYRPRSAGQQRNIRIRLRPGQIIVSYPRGLAAGRVNSFVRQQRDWIRHHLEPAPVYETGLELAGRNRLLVDPAAKRCHWQRRQNQLVVVDDRRLIEAAIKRLLNRLALEKLKPRALALAGQTGLGQPRQWRFGYLVSRWGSYCWQARTGRDTISLNSALIHLPDQLIDLVIVHELCHLHLKTLGHDGRFWQLFEQHYPGARTLSRQMSASYRIGLVPAASQKTARPALL